MRFKEFLTEATLTPGYYVARDNGMVPHLYEFGVSGMAWSVKPGDPMTLVRRAKHWPNHRLADLVDGPEKEKVLRRENPKGPVVCWKVNMGKHTYMFPEEDLLKLKLERMHGLEDETD